MRGNALVHAIRYFAGLEPAHTQTTEAEREELARHVACARLAVEIGVFEGVTTARLAEALGEGALLIGIDPFVRGRLGICWSRSIALSMTSKWRLAGKVRFIEKLSRDAGREVEGPVDFVFIDGDHSFEGIRADWETWSPKVAPNGIVALHDVLPRPGATTTLGSEVYYRDVISRDGRFGPVATVGVLAVLRRLR